MGELNQEESNAQTAPITLSSVTDNDRFVFSYGLSGSGEDGQLHVPSSAILSENVGAFFPDTINIEQFSHGTTHSGTFRYERDIITAPETGGFYLKSGMDTTISIGNGQFSVRTREAIDYARESVKEFARDQIAGTRNQLIANGIENPESIIEQASRASDQALTFVLENPAQIRDFRASNIDIPSNVPPEARAVIENALSDVDEYVTRPEIQNALTEIDNANELRDNGLRYDYTAIALSAGAYVEAGNEIQNVNIAGVQFDQVDMFATARVGYGATVYSMEEKGLYGCYGPEASVGVGVRGHFNEQVAAVARVDHQLPTTRDCPGGVTQDLDESTSAHIGIEIKIGEEAPPTEGTGEGPILMKF